MILLLSTLILLARSGITSNLIHNYNEEILTVSVSFEKNQKLQVIGFYNQSVNIPAYKNQFPQDFISCKMDDCSCIDNIVQIGHHPNLNPVRSILDVNCNHEVLTFRRHQTIKLVPYIYSHPQLGNRNLQQSSTNSTAVAYNDSDMSASLKVSSLLTIKWLFSIDGTSIEFGIIWGQQSWLGIGFGNGMSNVDMFNINIVNGVLNLQDLFSSSENTPTIDAVQNLNLTQQTISNSSVKFRFTRKLSTGDSKDTVLAQNATYTFCYAYSTALSKQLYYLSNGKSLEQQKLFQDNFKSFRHSTKTFQHADIYIIIDPFMIIIQIKQLEKTYLGKCDQ
ncbi:hypothetical protein pb186bvf_001038 [Paramecium bursaria]